MDTDDLPNYENVSTPSPMMMSPLAASTKIPTPSSRFADTSRINTSQFAIKQPQHHRAASGTSSPLPPQQKVSAAGAEPVARRPSSALGSR